MATPGVPMSWIGIRELQVGLSRHIASVGDGGTITVTDHGRPVARIVPVDRRATVERLVAQGVVQPARAPKRPAPDPLVTEGSVSDLLADRRR